MAAKFVGRLVQDVPVRSSNRTTGFNFSYTFTDEDARIGKVTFTAVATIENVRDALPADNETISLPTKVGSGKGVRAGTAEEGMDEVLLFLPRTREGGQPEW